MLIATKFITALVLPPAGLILLALLGLWLIAGPRPAWRRFGMVLASVSLAALLVLSLPAVGKRLLASLETLPPISTEQLAEARAIVVLGGGLYAGGREYGGDTVNAYTLERLRYAARLARSAKLPVLVTGGAPEGGTPEAQAMREVLSGEFGVTVRWTESAARTTAENARFAARVLKDAGIERIVLVSHGWHLPRAVPLFAAEGLQVAPAPTVYSTPAEVTWLDWLPGDFRYSRIALREYLGRAVDRLRALF